MNRRQRAVLIFAVLGFFGANPSSRAAGHAEDVDSTSAQPSDPDQADQAARCLQHRTTPDGKWKAGTNSKDLCKKGYPTDDYHTTNGSYEVRTVDRRIEVKLDIYFQYKGNVQNWSAVEARIKPVLECVKDFYQKNGIYLTLNAKVNGGYYDWWTSSKVINLWDERPRADDENWNMLTSGGFLRKPSQLCATAAHEIGHAMNLPDRYPDPNCPDRDPRVLGQVDNVMRSSYLLGGIEYVRLYPIDLADILKPLCQGQM